ncbi:hypothetical protein V5O48_000700 [Marasmius crinis-equi]|uniref:Peptidase S9 prolyl oligopeptidase catalytic domain-containing protein n=1 Tax=Marasmius crinis-equi TaxID=585013 RepID=A0ABR3G0F8_9AGAR
MPQTAPFGTWSSPITAEAITGSGISLPGVVVDPSTSIVYHLEGRPAEGGRTALVESKSGKDLIGRDFNASSGVHEYGGGPAIVRDGKAYFSHLKDGRIYRVDVAGGEPEAITPENPAHRFACFDIHPTANRFLVAVLEDHTNDTPSAIVNTLCLVDISSGKVTTDFVSGVDFYAMPQFSPDGTRLVWQQWVHPDMPWEGSNVCIADVAVSSGSLHLQNTTFIAGEKGNVSAGYPSWASNDTVVFLSDVSGFTNPWKYTNGKASPILPKPISEDFSECMWSLSMFPYAVVDEAGKWGVFASFKEGRTVLKLIDIVSGETKELSCPYVLVDSVRTVSRSAHQIAFVGCKADEGQSVVQGVISNLDSPSPLAISFTTLKADANSAKFDRGVVSTPQGISLKVPPNQDLLHVIYYPPHNPAYSGSSIDGEKPPCVVSAHGGPTGMAYQRLKWQIQYFTSRGLAWLDVDYGGSYGYGRSYRDRLIGQWGIVDVEDCIKAAKLMSGEPYNYVDPKRLVIRGGSAGGLTVLAALCHSSDLKTFAAGTSLYGVSDLLALAEMTHKFESQYGFKLLGGTPKEVPKNYHDRSPINHVDSFETPLLILQGEIDKVVPKGQAEAMYNSIKERGGVVEYQLYEGEGHGFRQKDHQKDALERELGFYEKVLGLKHD